MYLFFKEGNDEKKTSSQYLKDDNVKIKENVNERIKYFAVLHINEMHV